MRSISFEFFYPNAIRGVLRPLVILSLFIGLITFYTISVPILKRKLASPPVYKPSESNAYIKIQANAQTETEVRQKGTRALLPEAVWVPQSFNNCGPATVSMLLQYFGYSVDQNETKRHLRTNPDDKNVFTYEIQDYLKTQYGIESKLLYNGNAETLKILITNGFYVMVEDWLHPNEDIGHVAILRGFDDEQRVFIADDSYMGVNITYNYEEFDKAQWKPFNREYLPVYKTDQEQLLKKIIGENWDETTMYKRAIQTALREIENNEKDMYAYFNLGTSYYALQEYQKAKEAFEISKSLGWPKRMLWYQIQPIQTFNELSNYKEALELANQGLWANDSFAELHFEKARAYKGLGEIDKAWDEAQNALYYSPTLQKSRDLLTSL